MAMNMVMAMAMTVMENIQKDITTRRKNRCLRTFLNLEEVSN